MSNKASNWLLLLIGFLMIAMYVYVWMHSSESRELFDLPSSGLTIRQFYG